MTLPKISRTAVQLQAIIESIPDAIYVGTEDGITIANIPALISLGYESVEELNREIGELAREIKTRDPITGATISESEQPFVHALAGRAETREVMITHRVTGEDRIVRSAAAPVIVDGNVIAAVAVNTDVTDMKRKEAALEKAVRDRDDIMAVVSHDLRNQLTVVTGGLALLSLSETPGDRRETVDLMTAAAGSMRELIEDLLDLSTFEAGGFSMQAKPESAAKMVLEACERFRGLASRKSIAVVCAEDLEDLPEVLADARRIHQVFSNLIGNAVKFSPPQTTITVRAERAGEVVRFSVSDQGPGIPADMRERIFDRFFQARAGAQRGSIGLGLAIVKGIVDAHGGRIHVESTPGQGSTFYFTLHAVHSS